MKTATPSTKLTVPVKGRDHIQGSLDAAIKLLEYGDFECSFCGEAHPYVKAVQERLRDDVCVAFRHFPLTNVHPHAERAAEAAEAAGAQGKFWEMHDMLFENQDALEDDDLLRYVGEIGLDVPRFVAELDSGIHTARVRENFKDGVRAGVNGTPTFFVNGERFDDPRGYAALPEVLSDMV
jgi:protein-disulfide isomerase